MDMALPEQNRAAMGELSALVKDAVASFVLNLNLAQPEQSRDALLEFLPALVASYGDVAEAMALEHYEAMRAASGARGAFRATAPPQRLITDEVVVAKVRYQAQHLWTPTPEKIIPALQDATDKYIKQPGRDVIGWNAYKEKVRWARVPRGPKTCSFCLVMASRSASDAVPGYLSRETALFSRDTGDRWHGGNCQCEAIRLGVGDEYPEHYLPDDYLAMYREALDKTGTTNINAITHAMRRLFPDELTDGVVDPHFN